MGFFLYLCGNVIFLIFVLQCYFSYICVAMLFFLYLCCNVIQLIFVLQCCSSYIWYIMLLFLYMCFCVVLMSMWQNDNCPVSLLLELIFIMTFLEGRLSLIKLSSNSLIHVSSDCRDFTVNAIL